MKIIQLYGKLGETFGKQFMLEVSTPAEAIRALCTQLKGFRSYIENNSEPGYVVKVSEDEKTVESLHDPVSNKEVIKIIPIISGADGDGDGWVNIIIGVVLLVVAWYVAPYYGGLASALYGMGASMIVGGISALLAPAPPTAEPPKKVEERASYLYNGVVNTIGPGNAVAIGYGTLLIGSQVISAEITTVEEILQ